MTSRSADADDCPICRRGEPLDVLLDIGVAWVTAPPEAPLPGYVAVVTKRHVVEPFELETGEGHAFWDALAWVSRAVSRATGAIKMNYEIHGNTLPHLHVHLYPRRPGDPFEGRPIDGATTGFHRSAEEIARLTAAIREATPGGRSSAHC
jgi:diadenosine tetraphosphate (Ap4A) HIT family hydrolase